MQKLLQSRSRRSQGILSARYAGRPRSRIAPDEEYKRREVLPGTIPLDLPSSPVSLVVPAPNRFLRHSNFRKGIILSSPHSSLVAFPNYTSERFATNSYPVCFFLRCPDQRYRREDKRLVLFPYLSLFISSS